MKKILVTGATGFVGSHVIDELISKGHHVIASSSNETTARNKKWFESIEYIPLDLSHLNSEVNYFDYFGQPDFLIHLAWEGLPNYMNDFHVNENLPRHQSFISNMISNGLKDLTVSGTCFEYGMMSGCLSEDMQVNPSNPYAIAKNMLRKYVESLSLESGTCFKWIRLFYMFGEGQNPKSLISQLDKALSEDDKAFNMSGGMQVRDFLHISKVAEYIVSIALQCETTGIINCCSGAPVSVKDFVIEYLKMKNRSIELNLGYYDYASYEPMEFWGDDSKLKKILG